MAKPLNEQSEPDSYEAACDRFNQAAAAYHRAKAEAERIMRDADDERETASAHLARFEKSPGIPLPECDPLQRDDAEPAAPDTHKESAWCEKCGSAVGPVAPVVFVVADFAPAPGATADDIDGLLDPETIYLCKTCAGGGEPGTADPEADAQGGMSQFGSLPVVDHDDPGYGDGR